MGNKPARQPDFIPEDNSSSTMPFLTLSIFILLLAFFVVLNTNSDFEVTKTSPVMESLEKQFSRDFSGPSEYSSESKDDSNSEGQGSALELLESLFTSASISFEIHKIDGEGIFFITMDKKDFEHALSQVIDGMIIQGTPEEGKVFERYIAIFTQITAMTSSSKKNLRYNMSVFLHPNDTTKIISSYSKDLTKYAEQLKTIGLEKNSMSFGIKPIKSDLVELYFQKQDYQ